MTTSADLGISYIAGQQAQPEITHNTALNQIQILMTGVISVALNTPPGSPAQGDTYILGASPTGAWAGRANCLAGYFGTGWVFVPGNTSAGTPITMGARQEGLRVWSKADDKAYVWSGTAWAAIAVGMANPMTTAGDLITGGASGTPGRLAVGTNGFVLTVVAGAVAWAAATGLTNPMTTTGDIIYGGASGVPTRLAAGTNGHVLTLAGGVPTWAAAGGSQLGIASAIASGDVYPMFKPVGNMDVQAPTSTTRTQFNVAEIDAPITITDIVLAIRTTSAGQTIDVGIYQFLGCGKPGTCLAKGQISTTTAGKILGSVGTPVTLQPGLYYIAIHATSTAPTFASSHASYQWVQHIPLAITNGFEYLAAVGNHFESLLVNDSTLPGGAYTYGMNLTGFTMSSTSIFDFLSVFPLVGLKKQ